VINRLEFKEARVTGRQSLKTQALGSNRSFNKSGLHLEKCKY